MLINFQAGKQAPIFSDASLIVDYLVKKGFSYDTGQISFNKYAAKMRIEPSYIPIMHYNIIKVLEIFVNLILMEHGFFFLSRKMTFVYDMKFNKK